MRNIECDYFDVTVEIHMSSGIVAHIFRAFRRKKIRGGITGQEYRTAHH
jgi:hypothetical protein